jgi:hypothetical protein
MTISDSNKIGCAIPSSKNQVKTKVYAEANVFNATHRELHLQGKEYHMQD